MDKEKILTIILGLLVGGLLAGGYFFSTRILPNLDKKASQTISLNEKPKNEKGSNSSAKKGAITINTPSDFTDTIEEIISISGTASPNSKLFVFSNADEKLIVASDTGIYSTDIKLEQGDNEVVVTNMDEGTFAKRTVIREIVEK